MKITLDNEKLLNALRAIVLNTTINNYAVERVAFGYEKPGDKAPIDLYLEHLFSDFDYAPQMRKDILGIYIDKHERISAKQDYAAYVHDLFVYQIERIFFDAPKDVYLERDGEEIPLLPHFRDYLFDIEPLFAEVLNVEVEYNAFDVTLTNKEARTTEYSKRVKFITDILLKPLRSGSQINRYVKDFTFTPYYIRRLIEKKGKNFYLKSTDINSYEYLFALFSLMNFKNDKNGKLLELKMMEWEHRHRKE